VDRCAKDGPMGVSNKARSGCNRDEFKLAAKLSAETGHANKITIEPAMGPMIFCCRERQQRRLDQWSGS
jgi:hypothetical protein